MGAPFGRSGACSYRILPVELFIRRFERHGQGHARLLYYCMAVPMGVCTHIVTGGVFVATPHCVRAVMGDTKNMIARISLPCFVDTPPTFPLSVPRDATKERVLDAAVRHDRVPPLEKRWTQDGMTFGDFLTQTFTLYYDWNGHPEQSRVEDSL